MAAHAQAVDITGRFSSPSGLGMRLRYKILLLVGILVFPMRGMTVWQESYGFLKVAQLEIVYNNDIIVSL